MVSNTLFAAFSAASFLLPAVSAFDPQANTNVAVYYGQGKGQERLRHFCDDPSIDIINLGFLNVFPDQGLNGFPGTNFGNQCGSATFEIDGMDTQLLSNCHQLWEDIPICQAAGKKVMLSLGGARPKNQEIKNEESAKSFAKFLWYAFGPPTEQWAASGGPRPFKDVTLDGFDFDVEHNGPFGYAIMANELRGYFAQEPSRRFYLSAAPQCDIPDDQLSHAIIHAPFDFIWVQFYNTPHCSAFNFIEGTGKPGFNYDGWADVIRKSANPSAKLLIGLPASEGSSNSPMYYMSPSEVMVMVAVYINKYPEMFGGIMLWGATTSERNQNLRGSYADNMKWILNGLGPAPSTTSTPPHTSTTPTSMPSSSASTTSSTSPTSSTPATSSSASPSSSSSPTASSSTSSTGSPSSAKPTHPGSSAKPTTSKSAHHSSGSSKPSSSGHPSGSPSSSHRPTVVTPSTTSSFQVGRTSSTHKSRKPCTTGTSTGNQHSGAETPTVTSGITSAPGVSATGTTTAPETITTVIVTSYTSICPTGFTTITTTYTTTYCPATASATPTVTNAPTDVPAQTTAPPEGWTTTVTVCTHCAATPTTVTLTLPCETGTESPAGTSPGNGSPTGGSGVQPTTVPIIVPTPSSSRPWNSSGVGPVHPSKTLSFQPSGPSVVPTGPSTTQKDTSPVYTGAASRLQTRLAVCLPLVAAFLV